MMTLLHLLPGKPRRMVYLPALGELQIQIRRQITWRSEYYPEDEEEEEEEEEGIFGDT